MEKIYQSASKIVFILFSLALVVGMFLKIIDPKDFMTATFMALTYYFTRDKGTYQQSTEIKKDIQA